MFQTRFTTTMSGAALLMAFAAHTAHAGDKKVSSSAEDFARAFPGARVVEIEDFTGRIEIAVGGDELAIIMSQGAKAYPVDFIEEDGVLTIAGEERPDNFKIYKEINWRKHKDKAFDYYLKDYPVLKISAPKGAGLIMEDVITNAMAGDGLGHVEIERGYVQALLGNMGSADIGISGSGDVSIGKVKGPLEVAIGGSGDFDAVSAGMAKIVIGGSGDAEIGPIKGDAYLKVGGSGDIQIGDIAGAIDARINGSGSIVTQEIKKGAALSIAGNGDMEIASVNGQTSAKITGNGDIEIDGGVAKNLAVSITGNGDFELDGQSTNLVVSVVGSGTVDVKKNTGSLKTSGKNADITVNGARIKNTH